MIRILRWVVCTIVFGAALLSANGGMRAACAQDASKPDAPSADPSPAVKNTVGEILADSTSAVTLLALPMRGSYDQHTEGIMKLMSYAGPRGIVRDMPFGLYYNSPANTPADSLRWDLCVPVPTGTPAEPPFVVREMPPLFVAEVICTGPYEGVTACFDALSAWVEKNGYAIDGPCMEQWLGDPSTMPAEKLESRISFPIRKQ